MKKIRELLLVLFAFCFSALPANAESPRLTSVSMVASVVETIEDWDATRAYNVHGEEPGIKVRYEGKIYQLVATWAPAGCKPDAWPNVWKLISDDGGSSTGESGSTTGDTGTGTGSDTGSGSSDDDDTNTGHQMVGGLKKHLMIGYWHNFRNGLTGSGEGLKLSASPTSYDFLDVSFGETEGNDRATIVFKVDNSIYSSDADFIADVKKCQARGQKVILSLGGQNGVINIAKASDQEKFANSVISIIEKYGFDGLDIDFEGASVGLGYQGSFDAPTAAQKLVSDAIRKVCDHFGSNFILTMAPETAYVQFGINGSSAPAYLPLIYSLRDKLTVLHVQLYNTGTSEALDGKMYQPGTADYLVAMCDMLLKGFSNSGKTFPALAQDQVAIGIPSCTGAAGSGVASVDDVVKALKYLISGEKPAGISYTLSKAGGYPDFRGVMTWSVNWDCSKNYALANAVQNYYKTIDNPVVDGGDTGTGDNPSTGGDDNPSTGGDTGTGDNPSTGGEDVPNTGNKDNGYKFVVYFPQWGTYNANHQSITIGMIPWDKVTHINYGFFEVGNNYKIHSIDEWADFQKNFGHGDGYYKQGVPDSDLQNGHFAEIRYYKGLYPDVKVLVSVGGWTRGQNYHAMASTKANRTTFINSVVDFFKKYTFIDGIDFDWEYPGVDRAADPNDSNDHGCPGGPDDGANFVSLMKEMRETFNANGMSDKLMTMAATMNQETVKKGANPAEYAKYLNFINIMAYDAHGAFERVTNHHAAIYPNPNDPATTDNEKKFNASDAAKFYAECGVDKSKLIIGSPWYSRGWGGVEAGPNGDGLFQKATGYYRGGLDDTSTPQPGGQEPWFKIKNSMENQGGYVKYFDPVSYVPYLYNATSKVFLTYEDEKSLTERCNLVKKNGYGGIIVWDISGDDLSGVTDGSSTKAGAAPMSRIVYNELYADSATGIGYVKAETRNDSDNAFYTLSGIKVLHPRAGIYIHKGKKVVVR